MSHDDMFDSTQTKMGFPPWNRRFHNILIGIFIITGLPMNVVGVAYFSTYISYFPFIYYLTFFLIIIVFIASNGGLKINGQIGVKNIINSSTWPARDYPKYYEYMKEADLYYKEQLLFLTICGIKAHHQKKYGKTWLPKNGLPPMPFLTQTNELNEKDVLSALNGLKQRGLIPKSIKITGYAYKEPEFYEV